MKIEAADIREGDVLILGGRIAHVVQKAFWFEGYDVVFTRPGSPNAACYHVRGAVELVQRGETYVPAS